MNLKDLRQAVFDSVDWDPNASSSANDRVNRMINRAQDQMSVEAPFLFLEERLPLRFEPDEVSSTDVANDTVSLVTEVTEPFLAAYNPWTWRIDLPVATDGTPTTQSGQVVWYQSIADAIPKAWAGRKIAITTDSGEVITNQIRSVWLEDVDVGGTIYTYVVMTMVTPWLEEVFGHGPYAYRVYTEDYYLPDDVIELKSVRLLDNDQRKPLEVVPQAEAERYEIPRVNDGTPEEGAPRVMYRGNYVQIPGPNVAPAVATSGDWVGPEPAGTFQYVLTYCWGKRAVYNPGIALWSHEAVEWTEPTSTATVDPDREATMRKREPVWESAPSPVSATATVEAPTAVPDNSPAVQLTLPNIEYMLGFLLSGKTDDPIANTTFRRRSVAHSGWHVRIYRRRLTSNFTRYTSLGVTIAGQHVPALHKLDSDDSFYLLAEMRLDEYNEGRFIDDGSYIPDRSRKLRTVNGYQGMRVWPVPDQDYFAEVRCIRRPQKLSSDQDVPMLPAVACDMLVQRTLVYVYESLHDQQSALLAMQRYSDALNQAKKRYGLVLPAGQPVHRGMVRAPRR